MYVYMYVFTCAYVWMYICLYVSNNSGRKDTIHLNDSKEEYMGKYGMKKGKGEMM